MRPREPRERTRTGVVRLSVRSWVALLCLIQPERAPDRKISACSFVYRVALWPVAAVNPCSGSRRSITHCGLRHNGGHLPHSTQLLVLAPLPQARCAGTATPTARRVESETGLPKAQPYVCLGYDGPSVCSQAARVSLEPMGVSRDNGCSPMRPTARCRPRIGGRARKVSGFGRRTACPGGSAQRSVWRIDLVCRTRTKSDDADRGGAAGARI